MTVAAFAITGASSCKHSLDAKAYQAYVTAPSNGLCREVRSAGWLFRIQYEPADYILLREFGTAKSQTEAYSKRKAALAGAAWFTIAISREGSGKSESPLRYGVSGLEEYNGRLSYYLNKAQQDLRLNCGSDTLAPASYLFETNYNLTPQETMVVGFILPHNDKEICQPIQLSYYDRMFRNGIIKASWTAEELKNIPALSAQ